MKRKKLPIWAVVLLFLSLAIACIGTTWLIGASIADPELYAKVTDPVKAFAVRQIYTAEAVVNTVASAVVNSIIFSIDFVKDKSTEAKKELVAFVDSLKPVEESDIPPPDAQALDDSELLIPRDMADANTTQFLTRSGTQQEILTGGNYPLIYFNQTDPEWGNYGTDSIKGYGCGPTAMAMVVSTLTGLYIDPQEMADIFVREGFWASGGGTYYQFAEESGELFGLDVTFVPPEECSANTLLQHLMAKELAIALVSKGHFTNGGHFIVLRGVTLTGDVLVADPASRERSLTTWDPQLILDELSPVRLNGAPLWFFTLQ